MRRGLPAWSSRATGERWLVHPLLLEERDEVRAAERHGHQVVGEGLHALRGRASVSADRGSILLSVRVNAGVLLTH
jgi:hypothetical protein